MVMSVSDYHAPTLPLERPYFTGFEGIERVNTHVHMDPQHSSDAICFHCTVKFQGIHILPYSPILN